MRQRITLVTLLGLALLLGVAGGAAALGVADLPTEGEAPPARDDASTGELLSAARGSGSDAGGPGAGQPVVVDPGYGFGDALGGDAALLVAATVGGLMLTAVALYGGARFVTRDSVLENDTRSSIFNYVKTEVGVNLKQITDDLDLTTTNAIWHLRKLEDAGLVHSKRFNGYKVFYPAEGGVEARRMSLSVVALNNDNAQSVFEYVVANPGAHQREIARALGVNHGTVRWHLKKLRKAEILTEVREGKASTYYPTEMGLQALAQVQPGAPARGTTVGANAQAQ